MIFYTFTTTEQIQKNTLNKMIEIINYKDLIYPSFQSKGFASEFAIPYAKKICKGIGVDVGCNRIDWMYEGDILNSENVNHYEKWLNDVISSNKTSNSFPIDPVINKYDALNFPEKCSDLDYIFSSHCLEHLQDWVSVLDYWTSKLKNGGVLFLYLPDYSQVYWRPWNNRKHLNILSPDIIKDYLIDKGYSKVFVSSIDLNNSFMAMAEK